KRPSSLRANDLPRLFTIVSPRPSPIAQRRDRHLVPVEVQPHVSAALAAGSGGEAAARAGSDALICVKQADAPLSRDYSVSVFLQQRKNRMHPTAPSMKINGTSSCSILMTMVRSR